MRRLYRTAKESRFARYALYLCVMAIVSLMASGWLIRPTIVAQRLQLVRVLTELLQTKDSSSSGQLAMKRLARLKEFAYNVNVWETDGKGTILSAAQTTPITFPWDTLQLPVEDGETTLAGSFWESQVYATRLPDNRSHYIVFQFLPGGPVI